MLRPLQARNRRNPAFAVFLFPTSSEVRQVDKLPAPGTRVRSSNGRSWTVQQAFRSGRETFTVVCVSHSEYRKQQRGDDVVVDLAGDLVLRARDVASSGKRKWRRWKRRHYLP